MSIKTRSVGESANWVEISRAPPCACAKLVHWSFMVCVLKDGLHLWRQNLTLLSVLVSGVFLRQNKLCACAGGAPPIFSACGRGLLLKLATFDRSVTEAKQHLLSITWPLRGRGLGIINKNPLSVRFQYDPQSVIRLCLNASIIGIFKPTIGSPTLQLQIPIQISIWSPIRHATVLKSVHNRHFLTYNWFSSLQLQIPIQISIWSPIRHSTVQKRAHNRHFLTYNWFSSL